jgi:hypothetical protein
VFGTEGERIDSREKWSEYMAWFEDTQARLRTAVQKVGGIPPLPAHLAFSTDEDPDAEA